MCTNTLFVRFKKQNVPQFQKILRSSLIKGELLEVIYRLHNRFLNFRDFIRKSARPDKHFILFQFFIQFNPDFHTDAPYCICQPGNRFAS